jgi:hypothetical protein
MHAFRLNINNPDHLKIHKILRDLDLSIYKSKSSFIVEILKAHLLGDGEYVPLSDSDVAQQGGYVTKEYVDNLKADIRKELENEIRQELFNMVISAISGVGQAVKMEQTQSVKKNDTGVNDEETDKLMEELTNRWS